MRTCGYGPNGVPTFGELTCRAARGYLTVDGLRTNVFHLPVRGSGDGGIYSTLADIHSLWSALFAGRVVSRAWVAEVVQPRSQVSESTSYGLGFWLRPSREVVMLTGSDAGVSFHSLHDRTTRLTCTVVSNTSDGASPLTRHLDDRFLP